MDSAAGYYVLGVVSGIAVIPLIHLFAEVVHTWRWQRTFLRDRQMSETWRRDFERRAGKQWP